MLRLLTVVAAISAAHSNIVEEFVNGKSYVSCAVRPAHADTSMDCTNWFNVTDLHEHTKCGEKTNVPLVRFVTKDDHSVPTAMIAFENKEELIKYELDVRCDDTPVKMLMLKPENGFYEMIMVSNEKSAVSHGGILFSTKIPKLSEVHSAGIPSDWSLRCYEDDIHDIPLAP